jgi:hypothetical protein
MAGNGPGYTAPAPEGFIMSQTLPTELDALLFRGELVRGGDYEQWQFMLELAEYTVRGDVSPAQASALCDMLGLSHDEHEAAVRRAQAIN